MIETKDLILSKAKFSDWPDMYENVWSQWDSARYMLWSVTTSEEDAKIRMEKTMAFQKNHHAYLVYERASGKAIGFAGAEEVAPGVWKEIGICLGPKYVGRGYGKQILKALLAYCKETFGAREFLYTARADNAASNALARSLGFTQVGAEEEILERDGKAYTFLKYRRPL